MYLFNIEIKARSNNIDFIRRTLCNLNAEFRGKDHQVDTYFVVKKGRLKIREGDIERCLVYYEREDKAIPKESEVFLYTMDSTKELKDILLQLFDVMVIVDKVREIYYISNVKFHLDSLVSLGNFVEIEVINDGENRDSTNMTKQCRYYMEKLKITDNDLINVSYSDMLLVGHHRKANETQ